MKTLTGCLSIIGGITVVVILFAMCSRVSNTTENLQSPQASSAMDSSTLSLAHQFGSRCTNALESQDYGAAQEFCADAAQNWGALLHSGQVAHDRLLQSSQARTANFQAGDVGFVPVTFGHYVENTGSEDLVFLELFKSDVYRDVSLNDWLTHLPPDFVKQHLNISQEVLDAIPAGTLWHSSASDAPDAP